MLAQCWLHIGTEKTASTSVQTFLAQNRAALLARGCLYPGAAGVRAHHDLLAWVVNRTDKPDPQEAWRLALETEIVASGASTLVLSNERLATLLRRPAEMARVKALCDSLAQHTKVIVYLRDQTDFLVSRYTNVIWEGGTHDFAFRARTAIADYALLLERWSGIFGKENLAVRRFEPTDFPGGDAIADFADAIGLDTKGLRMPARTNPSLDAESLAFLRGLNRRLSPSLAARVQPFRGVIVRVLQRRRGGTRFTIPFPLARSIGDAYRDSNERVSAEYFGSRYNPLFSPPMLVSGSPVPNSIGAATAVRIGGYLAMGLLRDAVRWTGKRLSRQD